MTNKISPKKSPKRSLHKKNLTDFSKLWISVAIIFPDAPIKQWNSLGSRIGLSWCPVVRFKKSV